MEDLPESEERDEGSESLIHMNILDILKNSKLSFT